MSDPLHKIAGDIGAMRTDLEWIKKTLSEGKHEARITSLERWRTWVAGLCIGIGALLGIGTGHLPR